MEYLGLILDRYVTPSSSGFSQRYRIIPLSTSTKGLFGLGLDERHIMMTENERWFGCQSVVTKFGPMRPGREEMPMQFFQYKYKTAIHEVAHLVTTSIPLFVVILLLIYLI